MSGGTLTHFNRMSDYVQALAATNPSEALQIALAETERAKAMAEQAQAEYRAMAEVKFDNKGRIVEANLAGLYRLAAAYAKSQIVPEHYRSKYKPTGELIYDATPDCFIAVQMALRLGVDQLAYMQMSFLVHGKPGIETKLGTALLNTSGKIKGRIRYKDEFDNSGKIVACTASATDAETGDEVSSRVTWQMALDEGWVNKSGSKWKTMPDVMFKYRSAIFLIRLYYSEVLMGMQTVDEIEDTHVETVPSARTVAELEDRISASGNGAEPDSPAGLLGGTTDRPEDNPSTDATLIESLRSRLAECDTNALIDQVEKDFDAKAADDTERSIVVGECNQAREGLAAKAKAKGQKSFTN